MLSPFLPNALVCAAHASTRDLVLLAYLAIGPSAIAFTTWSYALSLVPVTRVMPFLYAVPLVALAMGWMWLDEIPPAASLAGCVLIIAGLVVVGRWGGASPAPAAREPASP